MRRTLFLAVIVVSACLAAAQQPPATTPDAVQICAHEFGDQFKVDSKFAPLIADLDGDGREDLAMVATSKNPLSGEFEFHYRAIDPYDGYFGWGNVKDTVQFSATNAGPNHFVLVIHDWRAPKAKFVIINLPFDRLSAGKIATRRRKAGVNTIHAVELGGMSSDVYWDGKKYKWEPGYVDSGYDSSQK